MDTELIVAVSQIATSIATLVVALFLAGQLVMQRKQLDAVHQDSARELGFAARTRVEELNLTRLTNNSLFDAYWNVGKAEDVASEIEIHKFTTLMRLSYLQLINSWNLGVNEKNIEFYKGSFGNLMGTPGERRYYLTNGRIIIKTVFELDDLANLGDAVYEEQEGSPVPA